MLRTLEADENFEESGVSEVPKYFVMGLASLALLGFGANLLQRFLVNRGNRVGRGFSEPSETHEGVKGGQADAARQARLRKFGKL